MAKVWLSASQPNRRCYTAPLNEERWIRAWQSRQKKTKPVTWTVNSMSAFYLPWDRVNIGTFLIKTEDKNRKKQKPFGITQARRGQHLCWFSLEFLNHCSSRCALCMLDAQLSGFQLLAVWLRMASAFPWTLWLHEGAIRAGSPALPLTFSE